MIMAQEFTFDAPDTVPAGHTRVTLMNHGTEPHHAFIVRLDSGHVAGELLQAFTSGDGRLPAWAFLVGGPNVNAEGLSEAVVELAPGNYAMICAIASPDGTTHVAKGMVRQLTVVPSDARTAAPTPDLTITMSDYAFTSSAPITAGQHVIRLENTGEQPHELIVIRLEPGKTIQEFAAWVRNRQGEAPGAPVGGTTPQSRGTTTFFVVNFSAGEYAFVCVVRDASDGRPHIAHGMVQQFRVD